MPLLARGWLLVLVLSIFYSNRRNAVYGGISKSFFICSNVWISLIDLYLAFNWNKVSWESETIFKTDARDLSSSRFGFSYAKRVVFKDRIAFSFGHLFYRDIVQLRTYRKVLDRSKHLYFLISFTQSKHKLHCNPLILYSTNQKLIWN